jgi:hypothetical protein
MNVKRAAAIVLCGGALAAWLARAATSSRDLPAARASRPSSLDARGTQLTAEIARLNDRIGPTVAPSRPARNLFTFREAIAAPSAPLVAPPVRPPAAVSAPLAAPALKLAGIGEDAAPDGGIVRTAFISGEGQLFVVRPGDNVTPRYRVVKVGADAVELLDLGDGTTRRLVWK